MAKFHLVVTSVSLVLASTLPAASADDMTLLKQAQGIFQAIAERGGHARSSQRRATRPARTDAVLRCATDHRRQYELFELPSTRILRNRRIAEIDRCQATPASA
jgi:hypothetical protein